MQSVLDVLIECKYYSWHTAELSSLVVLWLGLHWSSIAELHHFLNTSSILEALNKFWIDRVCGSVKLETVYLLSYLNIFFPPCLL